MSCEAVPPAAVQLLTEAGANVTAASSVATTITDGPNDLRRGAHYVAATVDGRPAVWVFGGRAFMGETGIIISVDKVAVQSTHLGADLDPVDFAIGPGDPDYENALACLKRGS